MSSQLSSSTTTTSDADEVLVLQKKKEVKEVSKTVTISIPDLLEEINEAKDNNGKIETDFKIGNKKFGFVVYPAFSGLILFGIENWDTEDVILSGEWKETQGPSTPRHFFNRRVTARSSAVGIGKFCCTFIRHDEYKQWAMIHGDVFNVKIALTLHLEESSNEWTTLRSKSLAVAVSDPPGAVEKMCLEEGVFADFTILSEEDRRFSCHRIILAAKSSTLKAMLTIEMKEKEENELKLRYNNQVVEAFVSYFYKGEVPPEVLEANLPSFLKLSDFYDLQPMKAQVENTAINGLTLENVVEMFSLANLHNAGAMKEATSFFILENKKDLGQQDLSQVPASVMTELFKLLSQS